MSPRPGTAWKLVVLSTLYFVQGLPFGFQATALPLYLREQGATRTAVGFLGALAMPWSLKALWAPLVDRYGSARVGKRRSWILPMQALLAAACAAAAMVPLPSGMPALLGLVLLMNLFAATMDIAVDGLAVDLLEPDELGHGNSAQVVGYKLGMLAGGGLLIWASSRIGWGSLMAAMAGLVGLVLAFTLTWREPAPREAAASVGEHESLASVVKAAAAALKLPGSGWLLLFIGTYKLGESVVDTMYKPFLVDAGFTKQQYGLWLGPYGMAASLLGSLAGGLLASRAPSIWTALAITSALRVGPMAGEVWLTIGSPDAAAALSVTLAEHFFGGALTTAVFAFMMGKVEPKVGATHYTLLASVEVLGKAPASWLSGLLADRLGYTTVFALGTAQAAMFLLLLIPLRNGGDGVRLSGIDGGGRAGGA